MKKQFDSYRRIARGLFSCSSLWAGPDHFVYVRGSGVLLPFVEEYKRFRFADIHAISMAPTAMYLWTSLLYGLGAALSAVIVFLPDYDPEGRVIAAIFFLPVLVVCFVSFVVTLARGPSCRCRIETAVGNVVIRPLTRTRTTRRAIEEMSELVREAQGGDYAGGPGGAGGNVPGIGEAVPTVAPAPAEDQPKAEKRIERSPFLIPTLVGLIVFGAFWVVYAFAGHWWPLVVLGVIDLVVFLGIAVSLVQQLRGFTPASLLLVLWVALAQQFLLMGAVFVAYIYWSVLISVSGTEGAEAELPPLAQLYERAEETGVLYNFSMINGFVSLLLGLTGVLLVRRVGERMRGGAKPPSLPVGAGAPGGAENE